jgi:hypothetical protein
MELLASVIVFTNSLAIFDNDVKGSLDHLMTMLVGFRQYVQYQVHGIKAHLHARMRKRVESLKMSMMKAKRTEDIKMKDKVGHTEYDDEEKIISSIEK